MRRRRYRCVDALYPHLQAVQQFFATDVVAYYDTDVFNFTSPLKIAGLSGLEAVNSFTSISYTKVTQGEAVNSERADHRRHRAAAHRGGERQLHGAVDQCLFTGIPVFGHFVFRLRIESASLLCAAPA